MEHAHYVMVQGKINHIGKWKCHYCNGGKTVLTGVVEFRTYPHQIEFGIEKEKRIHDLESIFPVINECIEENICTIYEDSIIHNQIRDILDIWKRTYKCFNNIY